MLARMRLLLAALILGALGYASVRPLGSLPPLGGILDPANGIWSLARSAEPPEEAAGTIPGLSAAVEVRVDDRGVPHIFAATEEDAWRAQGYAVARDRLFQLEIQRRATEGTLSEWFGSRALEADRAARVRGMARASDRSFTELDSTSLMGRAIRAYAEGVNAWIEAMPRSALPIEYRLIGRRPQRWEPKHTFYLFAQMALTLAWDDETLDRLRLRGLVGAAAAEALIPVNSPVQEPIQPNGSRAPRYDFARVPPPGPPDSAAIVAAAARQRVLETMGWRGDRNGSGDAIGSNNWAVAPGRTAAGYALLAGDPHLELTLPSIWYEIHLHVDGGIDVSGVTLVGAPGVTIGYNRDVAWSFTNTGADVRDLYAETVDSASHPTRYLLDGTWRPLAQQVSVVRDGAGKVLATDTLYATARGPMVMLEGRWTSVRWTPLDLVSGEENRGSGEEFLKLNRARSVDEWLEAWKTYVAPAQNGIIADRAGHIAIRSTGNFPVRPGAGRGDLLQDGSRSASDWTGYLPLSEYPFAKDPAQGFLASANQQPIDPQVTRRYFGANWPSPWRAMRINQLLRADSAMTPASMRALQTDPGSARADAFVPLLLEAAGRAEAKGGASATLLRAKRLLGEWDRRYTRENRRAVLFEQTMYMLGLILWDELTPAPGNAQRPVFTPSETIVLELMADSASAWWDDHRTAEREGRDALLVRALELGLTRAEKEYGSADGEGWRWSRAHSSNVNHLLRLGPLSALGLSVQGGTSTIGPSPGNGTHGASWRMVVELGPEVRAWGTYPGGQSGNPASAHYLDRIPVWQAGDLDSLFFPKAASEVAGARLRSTLTLKGGR